jgi:subtilisin-like proprotein convertase family protein
LAKFLLGIFLLTGSGIASAVAWRGWTFDSEVSGNQDGLTLKNVYFNGHKLIAMISLPVVRVFYDGNACGPYADRLGGTLSPIPWMGNATLGQREFTTADGTRWYEIGIRDQIGSYDLYQVYYLSEYGTLDAHIYSKGLQCVTNHIHYPNWRIDLDLDGASNEVIERNTGTGSVFTTLATEFNQSATSAVGHAWRVRDTVTGTRVDVLPGFPDFFIPDGGPGTVPYTAYNNNTVFGRLYKSSDSLAWTYGPNTQAPLNEGENINVKDVVLWYEAYLPHLANEGSAVWHSTGVRLVSNLGAPPPPPDGTTDKSFTNSARVEIPDKANGKPYPSIIKFSGVTGTVSKVKVVLNLLSHTYPADIDAVLVSPDGRAVKLMSDAGGGGDVNAVNLVFDQTAAGAGPLSPSQIVSGTYLPTDVGSTDAFPAPAPANANTAGTDLRAFNGIIASNANGDWKLYIVDDAAVDVGNIAGGWTLTLTTR